MPVGRVSVTETGAAITGLTWGGDGRDETPLLLRAQGQIAAYFDDPHHVFDLPIRIGGTPFLADLCAALGAIPAGETRTYGDLARQLGVSAQAVGQGCGANPIPIIVPCHRVLGAETLGGYSGAGGVETKVWFLRHEGAAGLLI